MSGSGVSPPVLLLNLKFALRGLSSSGVLSSGSQQLLSGVLSLSKIQSPYQTGAGLSWMKWLSFLWVLLRFRPFGLLHKQHYYWTASFLYLDPTSPRALDSRLTI